MPVRPALAAPQRLQVTHANVPLTPTPPQSVQLASAEVSHPPEPKRAIKKPMPLVGRTRSSESVATEQIVRVAQDAFAAGQPGYAAEMLRQGLKRYPKSAMLHRMLGESLYLDGSYTEATEVLQRAVKLDKYDAMSNELMGKSLAAIGNNQRATHYLLQAKECRRYAK